MQEADVLIFPQSLERAYSSIRESRELVLIPWLSNAILDRTPYSVMDYGAGDGKFLAHLANLFSGELWYFDPSKVFRKLAKQRLKNSAIRICSSPQSLRDESIDIVTSIAVWMTIPTYDGCIQYLSAQHRILKPGGSALIAVTHPCFREERYSTFSCDFDNGDYLDQGVSYSVKILDDQTSVLLKDYHWNLSVMVRQAIEAGFRLGGLYEISDVPFGNGRGAPWLCFDLRK